MPSLDVSLLPYASRKEAYEQAWVRSAGQDFYHSPAWLGILKACIATEISLFEFGSGSSDPVAWLPVAKSRFGKYVSLPMSPGVDFLFAGVRDRGQDLTDALLAAVNRLGLRYEFRSRRHVGAGQGDHEYYASQLRGLQQAKTAQRWSTNVKRNIKKAQAAGVTVEESADFDLMWEFLYRTRQRQGSPMYPIGLKQALRVAHGAGAPIRLLFSRTRSGEKVSGVILFEDLTRMTYAFGANCEDKELLATGANFLLFADCINHAVEKGLDVFDFGITPRDNTGLVRFKEQFGVKSSPAGILYSGSSAGGRKIKRSGAMVGVAGTVLQRMPVPLFRTLSPLLFKLLV